MRTTPSNKAAAIILLLIPLILLPACSRQFLYSPFYADETIDKGDVVEIADPYLEFTFRKTLGIGDEQDITEWDCSRISLIAGNYGEYYDSYIQLRSDAGLPVDKIADLTGLEAMVNLTELYLENNLITDLSAIAGLMELQRLSLSGNNFSSGFAAYEGSQLLQKPDLQHLWLRNCGLPSLPDLSGITKLEDIDLYGNNLTSLDPLLQCTSLQMINAENNSLTTLPNFSSHTDLWHLNLNNNPGLDITNLGGLDITNLTLNNCGLTAAEAAVLTANSNLSYLDLGNNSISDVTFVYTMINNGAFTSGATIELAGNPVPVTPDLEDLAAYAQNAGIQISY